MIHVWFLWNLKMCIMPAYWSKRTCPKRLR